MKIEIHNHSSYPRVEKGDLASILAQQEAAGCEVLTDGLAPWTDPFSLVVDQLEGVRSGEPVPYSEPAVRVRRPVVTGTIKRTKPLAVETFLAAQRLTRLPVKVVLPGPYTLACHTAELGPYTFEDLARAFAEVLTSEVADLASAGSRFVQIEEPSILGHPGDPQLLRQLFDPVWLARGQAQILLSVWGGDELPLYAQLNSIPVDILLLNLAVNPRLESLIRDVGASKILGLGLLDGCPDAPSADELVRRVQGMMRYYELDTLVLAPARGLRFLTAARAFDTLRQVARVGSLLRRSL